MEQPPGHDGARHEGHVTGAEMKRGSHSQLGPVCGNADGMCGQLAEALPRVSNEQRRNRQNDPGAAAERLAF